jgi:hypothetical protein
MTIDELKAHLSIRCLVVADIGGMSSSCTALAARRARSGYPTPTAASCPKTKE